MLFWHFTCVRAVDLLSSIRAWISHPSSLACGCLCSFLFLTVSLRDIDHCLQDVMVCTATELFESACQKMHPHFDRAFNEAGTPCIEGRTTGLPCPLFCPALICRGPCWLGICWKRKHNSGKMIQEHELLSVWRSLARKERFPIPSVFQILGVWTCADLALQTSPFLPA
jgi:hypothetical protein